MSKEKSIKQQVLEKFGKDKDPAFPFYPSDFCRDTMDLNHEEKGQLVDCMCCQHSNGEITELAIKNMFPYGLSDNVLNKLYVNDNGNYVYEPLERAIFKRQKYSEKQSKNGKKGGAPKGNRNALKYKQSLLQNNPNLTQNQAIGNGLGNGGSSEFGTDCRKLLKGNNSSNSIRLNCFEDEEVFFDCENNEFKIKQYTLKVKNKSFIEGIKRCNVNQIKSALFDFLNSVNQGYTQMEISNAKYLLHLLGESL